MELVDLISKHIATPINFGRVRGFTNSGAARGPLHDDFIAFQAKVERGKIAEIKWSGTGCSITMAAASMVAETLQGRHMITVVPAMIEVLAPLRGYNASCLSVVTEAIDCCFDSDPKNRGSVRVVR